MRFGEFFLPKWKRWTKSEWTWQRTSLLTVALLAFADSWSIPPYRNIDPGASAEGILFLIVGFRAVSKSEAPSTLVVIASALLLGLTSGMNHELLKSPSPIWTPIAIALLCFVMFWRRKWRWSSNEAHKN